MMSEIGVTRRGSSAERLERFVKPSGGGAGATGPRRLQSFFAIVTGGLKDLVAPSRCMGCLKEGAWLCSDCRRHLPPAVATCIGCGDQSSRGLVCSLCRADFVLSGVVSAGPYSHQTFKRGIRWLKFKGVRAVAPDLASMLLPHLSFIAPMQELSQHAVLVPIPLHRNRMRTRGFNQSEDIARAISHFTNIPTLNVLTRTKLTWTQSHLPHDLRSQNLADAFSIQTDVIARLDRAIQLLILIDDVTTTGATLEAAARALRQHVPSHIRIWAATIARG